MSFYSRDMLFIIENDFYLLNEEFRETNVKIDNLYQKLISEDSKKYTRFGLQRRFLYIYNSLRRIFNIYPPKRESLLDFNESNELVFSIQVFIINIFGILDNIAWVLVYENQSVFNIKKDQDVSLFKKEFQKNMPEKLLQYVKLPIIQNWYENYLKDYRDALMHKIPLYVPPSQLNEVDKIKFDELTNKIDINIKEGNFDNASTLMVEREYLGSLVPFFLHSFEKSPTIIHKQLIFDFNTISSIINEFIG